MTDSMKSALGFLSLQERNSKRWYYRSKRALSLAIERIMGGAVSTLPDKWKARLLLSTCQAIGIKSLIVEGQQGSIEGSLQDYGVFVPYLMERTFTSYIHERIENLVASNNRGTYIDIGANIGLTTIPVALRSSAWKIHSIEPDPFNSSLLERNLIRNGVLSRVSVHALALSDSNGTISLRRSPINFGDFRIAKDCSVDVRYEDNLWPSIEVLNKRLDEVLNIDNLVRPVVVKIDTQGAEPLVFKGGEKIFRSAELVVMEFWPDGMLRLNQDPLEFVAMLAKVFRRVEALEVSTARRIGSSFEDLEEIVKELLKERSSHHFDVVLSEPIS